MFADLLRKARKDLDLTQSQLEELTKEEYGEEDGVSSTNISRYENDKRRPSEESLEKLIEVLDVDEEMADRMREAVRRAKDRTSGPSGMVSDEEEVDAWLNAVLSSDLPGNARIVLGNLRSFLDADNWVAVATDEEIAETAKLDEDEVVSGIEHALRSPFLERVGDSKAMCVYRLTLPGE